MSRALAAVLAGALVGAAACGVAPAPRTRGARAGTPAPAAVAGPAATQPGVGESLRFEWDDVNTRKAVGREGDTFILDRIEAGITLYRAPRDAPLNERERQGARS